MGKTQISSREGEKEKTQCELHKAPQSPAARCVCSSDRVTDLFFIDRPIQKSPLDFVTNIKMCLDINYLKLQNLTSQSGSVAFYFLQPNSTDFHNYTQKFHPGFFFLWTGLLYRSRGEEPVNPARKNNIHCHQIEAKSATQKERRKEENQERSFFFVFKKPVDLSTLRDN